MLNVRSQFPFFKNNPNLTYLDSAATTQKPQMVIDATIDFYTKTNTNAGRSSYLLANQLTIDVERVREQVKSFLNAEKKDEIIFTSGATDSFNKVAHSLSLNYLKDGDEVLYCPHDHKSFVLPWFKVQKLLQRMGTKINLIPFSVSKLGGANIEDILSKISHKTKIINITHVHNIYGSDSDISRLREYLGNKNIIINTDATQSVGHISVDIKHLGADILSFSGHKMFANQGIGVMYAKKRLHKFLEPIFVGGGNGSTLINNEVVTTDFVQSYEAGTQNFAGIVSLGKAIEYIEQLGIRNIHSHLSELTQYLLSKLKLLNGIEFVYGPYHWGCADGIGILSFKLKGLSANEVGFILSEKDILVRTGDHCISTRDKFDDTIRVSLHIYNIKDDIDRLCEVISRISKP